MLSFLKGILSYPYLFKTSINKFSSGCRNRTVLFYESGGTTGEVLMMMSGKSETMAMTT